MNYAGSDLKFMVAMQIAGFTLATDSFVIVVKNGYGRVVRQIPRSECFFDSDQRPYFTLENMQNGIYFAIFLGGVADDDYTKQTAIVTDYQYLTTVGGVARSPEQGHQVRYTQVQVESVDTASYLADMDGNYILTSDGKRIELNVNNPIESMSKVQLQMTGNQFKQLIEGRSQDGTVNTVPEVLDTMSGIPDTETVKGEITAATEPKMDGVTQNQFDAIFYPEKN